MLKRKLLTLLVASATVSGYGMSANAATDNAATADATIVSPLTVAENATGAMDFGTISPDNDSVTSVLLTAAGGISSPGLIKAGLLGGHQAATFDVTGEDLAYDIQVPAGSINITNAALDTMSVGTFAASATSGTISGNSDSFTVGATLTVGAAQPVGSYSGTYTMTVTYQ